MGWRGPMGPPTLPPRATYENNETLRLWSCPSGGVHEPEPVALVVTGEVVAHICGKCLEACPPEPPSAALIQNSARPGGRLKP